MWKTIVLICTLIAIARCQDSTAVSQCIFHEGALPINTYIEGCTNTPCLLPQLQDVVLHIVFRAPHTIRSMRTLARAFLIGSIGINHGLGDEEVTCNFLTNTYCPLLAGEVVQYTLRMYIEPTFFVGTAVTIEFRIVDENEVEIVCIRVPVRIVAAISPVGFEGRNSTLLGDSEN